MAETLLKVVQEILNSIDGEEVDSISDTTESYNVAQIVKATFENLVSGQDFRELVKPFTMTAIGSSKPTLMERPDDIIDIKWVKYNVKSSTDVYPVLRTLDFVEIEDFLSLTVENLPQTSDTNIGSFTQNVSGSNIVFYYRKNKGPSFYTTIDDKYLIMDSYDSSVESSLQESKTYCLGQYKPTFTLTDGFEIPLDFKTTRQLVEEAKNRCSVEKRQTENPEAKRVARRLHVRSQFDNTQTGKLNHYNTLPSYGRRRK